MTETDTSTIMSSTHALRPGQVETAVSSSNQDTTLDDHHHATETLIRHRTGWIAIDWKEMFAYHELLLFLMWRDISARYKQTMLGGLWAVVQPLMMMTVFSLVFSRWGGTPHGFPYPVFVFAGLIPWTMFSQGFSQSALSLVSQQQLLTKVYFPRLFVPTAAASVFLIDLMVSLLIYVIFIAFYGYRLGWTAVFIPPMIVMTFVSTLSLGLIISALTVFYRDFRHLVPFITQMLLFMSCVIIPADNFSQRYRWGLSLNPMFGTIQGFRSALLGTPCDLVSVGISAMSAMVLFLFGIYYFCRTERKFADFA